MPDILNKHVQGALRGKFADVEYEAITNYIASLEKKEPDYSLDPNAPDSVRVGRDDYNLKPVISGSSMRRVPGRVHPKTLSKPVIKEVTSSWNGLLFGG